MRQLIREDDPARFSGAFAGTRPCDVNYVKGVEALRVLLSQDLHSHASGVGAENPAAAPRRIFRLPQGEKQHRAEKDPHDVQRPERTASLCHGSYNNQP